MKRLRKLLWSLKKSDKTDATGTKKPKDSLKDQLRKVIDRETCLEIDREENE